MRSKIIQTLKGQAASAACLHIRSTVEVLQTLVMALDADFGIWGAINLLEGYGTDTLKKRVEAWSS